MSTAARQARAVAGLCLDCDRRPAPNRARCKVHLEIHRERERQRMSRARSIGLCPKCGDPAAVGGIYCRPCVNYFAERVRRRREAA